MGKIFSFRYALLLSILLLSISSYGCAKEYIFPYPEKYISSIHREQYNSNKPVNTVIIDSFGSINSPIINDKTLNVLGTNISLGESDESIISKLGHPNRIAQSEYDFDYYVYNNNYSKLLFVAIRNNEVVGFYTDSIDFNYRGIISGHNLDKVNEVLGMDFSMEYVLSYSTENYNLNIFLDEIGTGSVTGIFLLASDVRENGYTEKTMKDIEFLVYDLTNSIRNRNGIPILSWSSTAAKAARKHCIDMAENNYFDHYDLYGKSPGDRLNEEGIYYSSIGENIIAGYGTAIISTHAWFNSPQHRDNILNKNYRNLGVGFTYREDSIYKTYITQNFYR